MVIVPGPDHRETWSEDLLSWIRQQGTNPGTDILSVCTGRRRACGPRALQSELSKMYPKAEFVGERLRWVREGNFCSGVIVWQLIKHSSLRWAGRNQRLHEGLLTGKSTWQMKP